jgi:hypothetical protein
VAGALLDPVHHHLAHGDLPRSEPFTQVRVCGQRSIGSRLLSLQRLQGFGNLVRLADCSVEVSIRS